MDKRMLLLLALPLEACSGERSTVIQPDIASAAVSPPGRGGFSTIPPKRDTDAAASQREEVY